MSNLKKKICEEINSIIPDDKKKNEIYNNIIEMQKKKRFTFKPILATCLSIFCFVSIIGIVYADEIENAFNTLLVKYIDKENKDGYKYTRLETLHCGIAEINYDANIPEAKSESAEDKKNGNMNNYYTYNELEELLDIKILKSKYFKNNLIHQKYTEKIDKKITKAGFYIINLMDIDYENIDHNKQYEFHHLTFGLNTKYAKDECYESWYSANESKFNEYYIEKLDTQAVVIDMSRGHYIYKFDYENIAYNMHFMFIPSKNWTEEQKEQRIKEIIVSFEY